MSLPNTSYKNFDRSIDGNETKFSYEKFLGRGHFAKAEKFTVTRPVVMKTADFNNNDHPEIMENALKEAIVLTRLCHPNIVRIFHAWTDESTKCLVMELEYCPGGNLQKAIFKQHGHRFPIEQVKRWFAQISAAIAYLHDLRIAHRDISSDNILLSPDKKSVKVTDFGMAKIREVAASAPVTSGVTTFKLKYLAPEVRAKQSDFKDNGYYTVDVWALGVIAFELATLEAPTKGFVDFNQSEIEEVVAKHVGPFSASLQDLIAANLLVADWKERATMADVLEHKFITSEVSTVDDYLHQQLIHLKSKVKTLEGIVEQKNLENGEIKRQLQTAYVTCAKMEKDAIENANELTAVSSRYESQLAVLRHEKERMKRLIESITIRRQVKPLSAEDLKAWFIAVKDGSLQKVLKFIQQGADCSAKNESDYGYTALHYCVENGCVELAQLLLEHGARVNERSRGFKETPLLKACVHDRKELAELFLEHGADVNTRTNDGETALMAAARNGNEELVILLVEDPLFTSLNHKNKYNDTALHYAIENRSWWKAAKYDRIVDYLKSKGATT